MTKGKLLEALSKFDDEQEVYVSLHGRDNPAGDGRGQALIIQAVESRPPWRGAGEIPDLVAIVVHAQNAEIR